MSAIQAAKSNRPKFEMITTTTPKEEKPKIKAANAAKMDEFRDKYFNPIQGRYLEGGEGWRRCQLLEDLGEG
jgi:hypothetical protein